MSHFDPMHPAEPSPQVLAMLARKTRRWLIGLALTTVALAAWGILSRRAHEASLAMITLESATPTVELVAPKVSTAVQELVLPADVEAFYDAPIYARVNGYLKSWAHDIGDHVKAGEVLGVIDAPDLEQQIEQANGELGHSLAQQDLARITAKRWTKLRNENAVSLQSTDEKTQDLIAKSSAATAAKASLDHLKVLESFLQLTAPFDGVVTERNTDIGALVEAGVGKRELFRLADIHAVRVYARVPQAYAAKMVIGLKAQLQLPQYPNRIFEGKIITTSNAFAINSRTMQVEVLVENPDGALMPGAYAEIRFKMPPHGKPLSIPAKTLVFRDAKPQVAVLDEKKHVSLRTISIERDLGTELEVKSGLTPQDRIIRSPWQSIRDGETVLVKDENGDKVAQESAK